VLWAKQAIFAAVTCVLMLATAFVAFGVGQALLGSHGTTLSAPNALRSIVGVAVYLTLVGIIAVSAGFILRNTAGGIASVVGLIIVLPALAHVLPQSWQHNYVPYLPSNAGGALYTIHPDPGTLSPWAGRLVMCLWAAAFVATSVVLLKRRDA
jgi:ABC-2 type transport system permease protein